MTDRPILFSGPMVRAILDGRKTQTRRVLGHHGEGGGRFNIFNPEAAWADNYVMDDGNAEWRARDTPYAPGNRFWVRESFCYSKSGGYDAKPGYDIETGENSVWYRATEEGQCEGPWRPSIHMPRWASRLTLIVTDVRVQRLQEIGEEDAISEGCRGFVSADGEDGTSPREEFQDLWDRLNATRAPWGSNPWVCAVTFTAHRQNIDSMETG